MRGVGLLRRVIAWHTGMVRTLESQEKDPYHLAFWGLEHIAGLQTSG